MQRITVYAFLAFFSLCLNPGIEAQTSVSEPDSSRKSLFEQVTKIPKRNKVFNFDLEMHAGFYSDFASRKLDEAAFRFKDIKIDITGEINDRLSYQYRQKMNAGYGNQPLDNLPESIELANIEYKLNDRFTLTAGKQDVFYGGWEYDPNPLTVYEYSDMNEYMFSYMLGLGLGYEITPSQEIRLQVTNSRMGSMEDDYGRLPEGVSKPKVPLFYTLNWNSSYLDELVGLRYSISAAEQARGKYMYNFSAGQNVTAGPFYMYLDVLYTRGALDPFGLITELTAVEAEEGAEEVLPETIQNCEYLSLVAEMQYRFHPKWQLFAKGMYETASIYKATDYLEKGKYRTAWGYQGGLEFYPMADDNLHLFLLGSGRTYQLTDRAGEWDASLDNTARISVGFVYRLPLY